MELRELHVLSCQALLCVLEELLLVVEPRSPLLPSCYNRVILGFRFALYHLCRVEMIIVIVSRFQVNIRPRMVGSTLSDNMHCFGCEF